MAKKLSSLSIFFPFYNEEANIAAQTREALKIAPLFARKWEIILVNDGSADKTGEIAQELAKKYPEVRAISHRQNKGYGAAIKSGLKNCRYDWIFFSDGDRQFNLKELEKLVEKNDQADLIIGYRQKRADSFIRLANAKLFNFLIRILFGLKVKDIDCAFKLIKKEVIENIWPLKSDGALVSSELLIKARKKGYKIIEVPVSHRPRQAGKQTGANPRVIFKAFYDIAALWKELK
ncbi:glycosyltransferase family 2 protein [Candidatus Shapirobacteria bacterium]|nr:glycosyltransferase family 2 protein [Candidatus Shapirobacteria bacterium]